MLSLIYPTLPSNNQLATFRAKQTAQRLSYKEVGATNGELPQGYRILHTRRKVGDGRDDFEIACESIRTWKQMELGWVNFDTQSSEVLTGTDITVVGRKWRLTWLNACRVVYVSDEREQSLRYSYAHGTLDDHIAIGEERFLVEMLSDGAVWYDILSFSRPKSLLVRIGYPIMLLAQKKFARCSADRLSEIVSASREARSLPATRPSPFV